MSFIRFILLCALTVTLSPQVLARETKVLCPSLSNLQHSADKIQYATFVNDAYIANTDPFAIHTSGMGWFVVVYQLKAASISQAIKFGQMTLRHLNSQKSLYAANMGGIYSCEYENGKVQVINNEEESLHLPHPINLF